MKEHRAKGRFTCMSSVFRIDAHTASSDRADRMDKLRRSSCSSSFSCRASRFGAVLQCCFQFLWLPSSPQSGWHRNRTASASGLLCAFLDRPLVARTAYEETERRVRVTRATSGRQHGEHGRTLFMQCVALRGPGLLHETGRICE